MSSITIKTPVTSYNEQVIQLPAYFKNKAAEYYVAVLKEKRSIVVQLYGHSTKVEIDQLGPYLDNCQPCTAEDFYHAAAQAMQKLNTALLPDLSKPVI